MNGLEHSDWNASSRPGEAPSLAKQNEVKMLGFAWFYSSESGLFNGLRRKQIEKILSPHSPPRGSFPESRLNPATGHGYSTDLDFRKENAQTFCLCFGSEDWPGCERTWDACPAVFP